jgi:hypothetical protein
VSNEAGKSLFLNTYKTEKLDTILSDFTGIALIPYNSEVMFIYLPLMKVLTEVIDFV